MKPHARQHAYPRFRHHRPTAAAAAPTAGATTAEAAADGALFTALLRQSEKLEIHPVLALATVAAVAFGVARLTTTMSAPRPEKDRHTARAGTDAEMTRSSAGR